MKEKYLTLEQNTCAARIFLNTFGLILENTNDINEFKKIKIFDTSMSEVGELYFQDGKVLMSANYNNSILEASFDIAKIFGLVDRECNNALFGQWSSKIIFQIQNENAIKLSGEFLIENSIDSEFGVTCICHPFINCEVLDQGSFNLVMLRRGKMFGLTINSKDYTETIDIMPFDDMNGFMKHTITKSEYDKEAHKHQYRKYAGVFSAGMGEYKDQLRLFITETEGNTTINSECEFVQKNEDDKSRDFFIQKGMLMQKLDPDMYEKIKKLRKVLIIGNVSLLDNLISVCYDTYTDEELSALLCIERKQMNYQNGANRLVNSYYEIGKNGYFLSLEEQKRLLKKF